MPQELFLRHIMMIHACVLPRMDNILAPLLAILVIIIPLGLAYVIVMPQARNQKDGNRNNGNQKEP